MNKKLIIAIVLLLVLGAILVGLFFRSTSARQAVTPDHKQLAAQLLDAKTAPVAKKVWPPEGTINDGYQKPTFISPSGRYRITNDADGSRAYYDLKLKKKTFISGASVVDRPNPWGIECFLYAAAWSPREDRFILHVSTGCDSGFSVFEVKNGVPIPTDISWENIPHPFYLSAYMGHFGVTGMKWLDDRNAVISFEANATRDWGGEYCCMAGGPINAWIDLEYQYTYGRKLRIRNRDIIVNTNQFKKSRIDDIFNYKETPDKYSADYYREYKCFRGKMSPSVIKKLRMRVTDKQDIMLLEELIGLNKACYNNI